MNEEQRKNQFQSYQTQKREKKGTIYTQKDRTQGGSIYFQKKIKLDHEQLPVNESSNNELPLFQLQRCSIGEQKESLNVNGISQICQQNKDGNLPLTNNWSGKYLYLPILQKIMNKSKENFPNEDLNLIQKIFIENIMIMDYHGLLNDEERKIVNVLIYSHLSEYYTQISSQSTSIIKQQDSYKYSKEDCLTNFSQNKNPYQLEQFETTSKILKKSDPKNSVNKGANKLFLNQRHQIFLKFLNISMVQSKIDKSMKFLCAQLKVWKKNHISEIGNFLNKLIVIKSFFPKHFCQITSSFVRIIEQFKLNKKCFVTESGIDVLIPRYINCLNIYSESDDIMAAANQLYKKQNKTSQSKRYNWVHDCFLNYQKQVKLKAQEWQLQKERSYEAIKQMESSNDSLERGPVKQNMIEGKNQENEKKVSFESFKQKHYAWNPIQRPKYFRIDTIFNSNPVQFDTFLHPEIQFQAPK